MPYLHKESWTIFLAVILIPCSEPVGLDSAAPFWGETVRVQSSLECRDYSLKAST